MIDNELKENPDAPEEFLKPKKIEPKIGRRELQEMQIKFEEDVMKLAAAFNENAKKR